MQVQKKLAPGYRWRNMQKDLLRMTAKDKLRFFCRGLFPAPGYMRWRYAVSPDRAIWPYYPYRWADQGLEFTRAVRAWSKVGS